MEAVQSLLIIARDGAKRDVFIEKFCREKGIGKFDQHIVAPIENTFGIEVVRNMQKTAFLAPVQGMQKAIILTNAQLLTTEAQNALLKLLEEPPLHTYIILSAATNAHFLPTVRSRCREIVLPEESSIISEKEREAVQQQLTLMQQGIAGKLALAEQIAADKENLSTWFVQSILLLREELLKNPKNTNVLQLITAIQNAYKDFQTTNVSPRMILEHYFLTYSLSE